jgi:hypothetical protein
MTIFLPHAVFLRVEVGLKLVETPGRPFSGESNSAALQIL